MEESGIYEGESIGDGDIEEWSRALKQYSDRYDDMPMIINELKNTNNVVDVEIKSVYINDDDTYIILEGDKKYFKGAYLADDYKIVDISLKKITLSKGDVEYEYLID